MRKSFAFAAIILFLSAAAGADELQIVSTVLELSDEQKQILVETIQARETAVRPLAEQLHLRHEALGALMQSNDADAATLGQLLLEIRMIEREVARITREAAAQFEQSLDQDQLERLEHIRQAAQVCPAIPAFHAAGLI
jgi:hypothetical protein